MDVTKSYYIYTLKPPRENFADTITPQEELIVGTHFNYLKNLLDEGKLIMAARTYNAKFGIVIFEAETEAEAQEIMNNDPAIVNKVFTAELNSLHIALIRT
jgi:uncharacterized protein YciI